MKEINGYFRVNECDKGHELAVYQKGFAMMHERYVIGYYKTREEALEAILEVLITTEFE